MSNSNSSANGKPALRVISAAWGDAYVDEFLTYCLPALLAPGNLPALSAHFASELVLLTEFRQFQRVRAHPAFRAASQHCETRLFAIDDLTAAARYHYGMAISYTLFRGFQDLGAKATDTWLLFVNSDFILADGSYANMTPHLLGEARIVFAPSYCTLEQPGRRLLQGARVPGDLHVSVPPRTMADWILRHRHYTMRAKTVNQRFFSIDQLDQFYWAVDERTLLGRQHPVALVAMKPERPLEDIHALWDYGVIADFCPGMNYVALGNSDDFLMMELRERDRAREQLSLGWPSQARIAKGLEHVVTAYTRAIGRIPLTLHSADLPATVEAERAQFDRYVDGGLSRLDGRLKSHENHIQWTVHLSEFHEARRQYLKSFPDGHPTQAQLDALAAANHAAAVHEAQLGETPAAIRRMTTPGNPTQAQLDALVGANHAAAVREAQFGEALAVIRRMTTPGSRDPMSMDIARLVETAFKYLENARHGREQIAQLEERFAHALVAAYRGEAGSEATLGECVTAMRLVLSSALHPLQLIEGEIGKLHWQCIEGRNELAGLGEAIERMNVAKSLNDSLRGSALGAGRSAGVAAQQKGWIRRLSRLLFGAAPAFHPWHVLYSCTRVGLGAARRRLAEARRVLLLSKQDIGIIERLDLEDREACIVALELTQIPNALVRCLEGEAPFDCCLVEGHIADMSQFRRIFDEARPLLRPGARLVALFLNMDLGGLKKHKPDFIQTAFPLCGPARTAYAGSRLAAAALSIRRHVHNLLQARLRVPSTIAIAASMFAAAPFALLGSIVECWRTLDNSSARPLTPTSITIEIDIG
jgi:hypothetical protein